MCSGGRIVDATTQNSATNETEARGLLVVVCLVIAPVLRSWGSATLRVALGVATALRQKPAFVGVACYNCAGWQCSD